VTTSLLPTAILGVVTSLRTRTAGRDVPENDTAAPVIAKYTGVLGGADIEIFTRTTTFAIMQSIRLDHGPSGPVHP
jgi:hypothetical protein